MRFGFSFFSSLCFFLIFFFCHFRWFCLFWLYSAFGVLLSFSFTFNIFPLHAWAIRYTFINYLSIFALLHSLAYTRASCCCRSFNGIRFYSHTKQYIWSERLWTVFLDGHQASLVYPKLLTGQHSYVEWKNVMH